MVVVGEIAEKLAKYGFLFVRQVRQVVQFVDVPDVGKHLVGIGHVLVYVVEVGQQQLSPAVEVVKGLVDACHPDETFIQVAYQLYLVAHGSCGVVAEQLADGHVGRAPHGSPGLSGQALAEEERCPLVGKYHCRACKLVAVLGQYVLRHKIKKCPHVVIHHMAPPSSTSSIWLEYTYHRNPVTFW